MPPWFSLFDTKKSLEQGVIIFEFPYLDIASLNQDVYDEKSDPDVVTSNLIILTQSCDLMNDKVRHIHLCPIYTWSEALLQNPDLMTVKQKTSEFERLKKGQQVDRYLTDKCQIATFPKFRNEYLMIALDQAIIAPNDYVRHRLSLRKRTLRLNPPYREAMAQAYGRYFMRVGNPVDIQPYNPVSYP